MFFSKKPIAFVKKASIITRNQQSLFKLVRNILKEKHYNVMYARPAYHVFDVDEHNNSKSNIKKGRDMVSHAYLDVIIVEAESLRAVCAFRMDEHGNQKASKWSDVTTNLVQAAESAQFPLFVVPDTKEYSTPDMLKRIRQVIPDSDFASQFRPSDEVKKQMKEEETTKKDPWVKGGYDKH